MPWLDLNEVPAIARFVCEFLQIAGRMPEQMNEIGEQKQSC
jgi:hypothetical protein